MLRSVFEFMGRRPFFFLAVPPLALLGLLIAGFTTQDDIVEDNVSNIWTATSGPYYDNRKYLENVTEGYTNPGRTSLSTFAGMAVSRDGGNLFTSSRLREIEQRMKAVDAVTVEHKERTFSNQDLCWSNSVGLGTTYRFACFRLTPMDLFEESKWSLDETARLTWYNDLVYPTLVRPRLARFGVMRDDCVREDSDDGDAKAPCDHEYRLRTDVAYAALNGYNEDHANPLLLFNDVGDLEMNNACKICIENEIVDGLGRMTVDYTRLLGDLVDLAKNDDDDELLVRARAALERVDHESVAEFRLYYTARTAYAEFGGSGYVDGYESFRAIPQLVELCRDCPDELTTADGVEALYRHADNTFSTVNTGGLPVPFWNPETGYLFDYGGDRNSNETLVLRPVGGSGLDLSGERLTPGKRAYTKEEILRDPGVVWFLGSVTPMTAHCSNGRLSGTNTGEAVDVISNVALMQASPSFCTEYDVPYETAGTRTQTHFAKMWYDLVIDSPPFLELVQGQSGPYTYTTGAGCGYELKQPRFSYVGQNEEEILRESSGEIYYIDEGESVGALDRNIMIGRAVPQVGAYGPDNPLQSVGSIQNLYITLSPEGIVERVKNCNRPDGPITDLTVEDAEEILYKYKIAFEEAWSESWQDETSGGVQFVGFYDDVGTVGTTGRMLEKVTLSGGRLMVISYVILALFSVLFLVDSDAVKSRAAITSIGVVLVILSFFAALGVAVLAGVKMNVTIGWTLPFIVIGLGVDDMYIVSLALRDRGIRYRDEDLVDTMEEVVVPITMTSLVNFCMFGVMNVSDIPAVYKTAQAAMIAVAFLWATVLFCFPAYCYLDLRRQRSGRRDVLCCKKSAKYASAGDTNRDTKVEENSMHVLYQRFYQPLIIDEGYLRTSVHVSVWLTTVALVAVGCYGATQAKVGLGLADFFPSDHQSGAWANYRRETLASWPISMNWGEVDYTNPDVQLKIVSQFERVLATPHVSDVDTSKLWIASLALWTTKQCDANFNRRDLSRGQCGHDFVYDDGTVCSGTWTKNTMGLRNKRFESEPCQASTVGVCRPTSQMHPDELETLAQAGVYNEVRDREESWCPVFEGWSKDKLRFCMEKWRDYTGGSSERVLIEAESASMYDSCEGEYYNDAKVLSPIKISSTPSMFSVYLYTHDDTVDLIKETRAICDEDSETHCFMSGLPYDFWEQYIYINSLLVESIAVSVAVGFAVSFVFLFGLLCRDRSHAVSQTFVGCFAGALIIAVTCVMSAITVIGLSALSDVSLTAFSVMSFVLSIGFMVEYSVHITHRFLTAPASLSTAKERTEYSMSFLFLPTFMSFVSSTIGVCCLAFTEFNFTRRYFFRPLIIVMFVTYFYGCFFLPVFLSSMNFDFMKLGKAEPKKVSMSDDQSEDLEGSDIQ